MAESTPQHTLLRLATLHESTLEVQKSQAEALIAIHKLQMEQRDSLNQITKHTGCLYTYLILSLFVGGVIAIIYVVF
jgi:hypothetical protein